jgi:hypothetical protein
VDILRDLEHLYGPTHARTIVMRRREMTSHITTVHHFHFLLALSLCSFSFVPRPSVLRLLHSTHLFDFSKCTNQVHTSSCTFGKQTIPLPYVYLNYPSLQICLSANQGSSSGTFKIVRVTLYTSGQLSNHENDLVGGPQVLLSTSHLRRVGNRTRCSSRFRASF